MILSSFEISFRQLRRMCCRLRSIRLCIMLGINLRVLLYCAFANANATVSFFDCFSISLSPSVSRPRSLDRA